MTASTGTTSPAATTMVQLEFSDFVDLQTRLVLLPRIEEEGRGAVVASFINNNDNGRTDKHDADHIATTKDKDENTPKEMQLEEEKEKNNATAQEDPSSLEETVKKEKMTDESSSSKVEHPKEEFSNDNDDDASGCGSDNNNEESEKIHDDNVSVSSVPEHAVPTSETMSRGDTPMIKQTSLLDEEEEEDEDEEELVDNSETTNEKEEGSSSSVQSKPQEEDTDNVCSSTSSSIEEKTHRNNDNNKEEEKENTKNQEEVIEEIHVMGKMLVGIGGKNSDNNDDNIAEMDFTDILSAIRQAPTPIILHFEPQPLILEEEEKSNKDTTINMIAVTSSQEEEAIIKEKEVICDDDDGTASSNTQPQEEEEDVDSDDNEEEAADAVTETQSFQAAAIRGTLSSWGSRLKVEAGPTFASLSSAAARAAAEVSERASKVRSAADQQQQEQKTQTDTAEETCRNQTNTSSSPSITLKTKPPCCGLFLQSSGKFIPLDATARVASSTSSHNNNKNSALPKVTNSSILIVRGTAQPDPTKQFSFQWCRSYTVEERKSGSTDGSKTSETSQDGVVREWVTLDGATFSAFQPSASDIGHRLRCVVTITKAPSKVDNDESDSDDDDEDEDEKLDEEREAEEEKVICELPEPVTADMSLFNGARTALLKGAKFNNMKGRGNANDRTFKINFEISSHAQAPSPKNGMKKKTLTSAMSIFQVSGSTAEPMHEDKIMSTSAISAPSHPKQFELYFPIGLPSSASMVSALSTENGRFQLEAPNRITRETFLMALGIANFQGRPADLNEKTVLYPKCDYDVDHGDDVSPPTKEFSASDSESVKSDMDDSTSESSSVQAAKGSIVEATDSGSTTPSDDVDKLKSLSPKIDSSAVDDERKIQELERELERDLRTMQNKLAKKDKTVTKLQKQLTKSNTKLTQSAKDMKDYRRKIDESNKSLRLAEKRIATHEDTIARMKKDSASHVSTLESRIDEQSVTLAEMEKLVRSLQNEKAVLSAAVDARDSKLSKMGTLQAAVDSLSVEVSKGDVIRADLNKSNKKCKDLQDELKKAQALENQRREELEESQRKVKELELSIANECKKTAACQAKVDTLQTQTQKLKSERNSSRQKADSLSKELSRICKNGMSLTDVEHIIQDDEARRFEVSLLREQKRKALEELDLYRTAFDQSLAAQQKAGINGEAVRALEQKSELERVVADLTEYVNAKEMQLETMKEVNQALQLELHQLAQKKTFDKNDI